VFLGALHHFPDQAATLGRAKELLRADGLVIAHEPVRDRVTPGNAAFVHMLRALFSINNNFYTKHEISVERKELLGEVDKIYNSLRYENEDGEKVQSINYNEAGMPKCIRSFAGCSSKSDLSGAMLFSMNSLAGFASMRKPMLEPRNF
jgi:hypothetical protein